MIHIIYLETISDLFDTNTEFLLVHCISSDFILGAGIAKTFRDEYSVRDELIDTGKINQWNGTGYCILTDSYKRGEKMWKVANLVTKEKCYHKPTYETLLQALEELKEYCWDYGYTKIAMPLIGCGLDGLNWDKVSQIIKDTFSNTICEIVVCRLN